MSCPRRKTAPSSTSASQGPNHPHLMVVQGDGTLKTKEATEVLVQGMMEPGKKNHNKIKRPLNAFMVWSKLQRRKIMDNDPTVHHSLISKQLGAGWKSLSEEARKPYYEEAQRLG